MVEPAADCHVWVSMVEPKPTDCRAIDSSADTDTETFANQTTRPNEDAYTLTKANSSDAIDPANDETTVG